MSLHLLRHLKASIAGSLRLSRDMDLLKALGFTVDETAEIIMAVIRDEAALPYRPTDREHRQRLGIKAHEWVTR